MGQATRNFGGGAWSDLLGSSIPGDAADSMAVRLLEPPNPLPWTAVIDTAPNPVATAEFFYEHLAMPSLRVVLSAAAGRSRLGLDVVSALLNVQYGAMDDHRRILDTRMRAACTGLQHVVRGFSATYGLLVYHQCLSVAAVSTSMFELLATLLVEAPITSCLCSSRSAQVLGLIAG